MMFISWILPGLLLLLGKVSTAPAETCWIPVVCGPKKIPTWATVKWTDPKVLEAAMREKYSKEMSDMAERANHLSSRMAEFKLALGDLESSTTQKAIDTAETTHAQKVIDTSTAETTHAEPTSPQIHDTTCSVSEVFEAVQTSSTQPQIDDTTFTITTTSQGQTTTKYQLPPSTPGNTVEWCKSANGIQYNGSCLWAETPTTSLNLATALKVCNEKAPSKLPEVYGEKEYLKIMKYLRSKIQEGRQEVLAWTGMTRDHTSGRAVLSNGQYAPYVKPRSTPSQWTAADSTRTHVYLVALKNPDDGNNGMGSLAPDNIISRPYGAILCQRN